MGHSADMPPNWQDILQKGERILWQGRPSARIHLRLPDLPMMLFGLAFAGFALFWMRMAGMGGGSFWMFGLIHFAVGLLVFTLPLVWRPLLRARTFYTLTDRRAFIARDLPMAGRNLDIYPINLMSELTLKPGNPGTIWFAPRSRGWGGFDLNRRIGFEFIPDAEQVFGQITRRQKEQA